MPDTKAVKLPSEAILKSLLSKGTTIKSKVADLNGGYGQAISDAADKHNLHASAFKLVAKLARMDPVKLNAYLTHLDDYRVKLGLDQLAATDLPGVDDEDDDEDDAPEPEAKKPMFEDKSKPAGRTAADDAAEQKEGADVTNITERLRRAATVN